MSVFHDDDDDNGRGDDEGAINRWRLLCLVADFAVRVEVPTVDQVCVRQQQTEQTLDAFVVPYAKACRAVWL